MSSPEIKILSLRLPQRLHERLTEVAAANRRSLNQEIVYRLIQLERKEQESGEPNR